MSSRICLAEALEVGTKTGTGTGIGTGINVGTGTLYIANGVGTYIGTGIGTIAFFSSDPLFWFSSSRHLKIII